MRKRNLRRVLSILLMLVMTLSLLPGAFAAPGDVTVTVIHVNDRHGRMGADPYISQLAKDTPGNVLILDAGDALHGQIATNLTDGAAMVELMNAVGYDAMTTGNHEYTFGIDRMKALTGMMDFPMLAANVKTEDGKNVFTPYKVFPMDGVTVGVFGIATPETYAASDPRIMAGLVFEDPVKTATAMVAELKKEGCNAIIAITHLGLDDLSNPADRSDTLAKVAGIDVVIDGHSHTELAEGLQTSGALIAQTGEYGKNIGVVDITVSGKSVSAKARLIPISADGAEPTLKADSAILAKIAALEAANEAVTSVVVGKSPAYLMGEKTPLRIGDSNLANLISDSMLWATGADVALIAGGNIRASIDEGDITMGEVLTTLPYSNLLVTVELSGADLVSAMEHGVSMYPEPAALFLHVAGMRFVFDPDAPSGSRVMTVTMADGSAIVPDKTYTVATIDYIAAGGDGYDMMLNAKNLKYYGGDAQAFIDYLATNPTINEQPEYRVSCDMGGALLYVVMPDATHGFMSESIRHAEAELERLAAETGLKYKLVKTADAALQSDALDAAIEMKAGAVVLWPITGELLRDAAQRVKDAGIPLIVYDRLITDLEPASEVLGDNMKIAKMAGAYFNKYFADDIAMGKTIDILELAGDDSTVPIQRTQGFMEVAGANVNVIASINTQWRRDNTRDLVADWLATADVAEIEAVKAIYSHEDEAVLGAMDAIAAYKGPAKLDIRLIIGLGGKRDVVIHTGYFKDTFGIDLVTYMFTPAMVREAIYDGARVAAGETPHTLCLLGTMEIDSNTLDAYLNSATYKTRYASTLPTFSDVPKDAWYADYAAGIAIEGIMGTGDTFKPDAIVNTDEALKMLATLLPYSATTVKGSKPLTRDTLAVMLYEMLAGYNIEVSAEAAGGSYLGFFGGDNKKALEFAYGSGIMKITGTNFSLKSTVTRAEMAAVISSVRDACLEAAAK